MEGEWKGNGSGPREEETSVDYIGRVNRLSKIA